MKVIVEKVFYVTEHETYEICDSPAIGCSETVDHGTKQHGPYPTQSAVKKAYDKIVRQRIKDGWGQAATDKNRLMKGNFDLWLGITEKVISEKPLQS